MRRGRGRLLAVGAVVAVLALGPGLGQAHAAEAQRRGAASLMEDLMADRGPIGGPFSLTDQHGQRSGTAQWQGQVVLLYFGYLSCPDVCPTDLAAIAAAIRLLGPLGARVQPVFVTLDPTRDTAEQIGPYAENFHPRFLALRGSDDELQKVAAMYKVYFEKVPRGDGHDYAIDHSSFTYVLDGNGRYIGFFPPGTTDSRIAERVRSLLGAP